MACYDCEECSKSIYNGGKCEQFEYDCPFIAIFKYKKEKIEELRATIKTIFHSINQLEKLDDEDFFDENLQQMKYQLNNIEESISEEAEKEWKIINSIR